ncbi:predicted protein [Sclerotinia sclerotiorum 1980 UF-70]|uniref:Uncharacterized protein n=2 Tax=Sclerotinia sclerotiorum (strain ATCC 18683 / 1980 / Ss-1) TaxID=665079 RepID=A7F839_SCLS1|nr:predicted protein [Sclerotinia sclerotiorum 1980 UF-70]APA13233.1 hypothetical protein sscle_10g080030 [Sclerotinia sclerotiorum 1980 UF-70]EDN98910.1 predicted protein [Sclerotinia sclerotiorum 1980 UF-70]
MHLDPAVVFLSDNGESSFAADQASDSPIHLVTPSSHFDSSNWSDLNSIGWDISRHLLEKVMLEGNGERENRYYYLVEISRLDFKKMDTG